MSSGRWGIPAAALIASPVVAGVAYSAAAATGLAGFGSRGFSTERLVRVLGEPTVWESLGWSIRTAALATLIAAVLAALVAVVFRQNTWTDRAARTLAVLPLPIPHLVAATTAVLVLGQSGILSRLGAAAGWLAEPADMVPLVYDRAGIGLVLALAWKELPFLALVSFTLLATRGTALEEAARSLGANRWETFSRVTWPLLWRGLMPSVLAVFAFAVGSYEAAALLAPSDPLALPLLTLERYTDPDLARRSDAFVLVLLGLGLTGMVVALHEWVRHRAAALDR